MNEFMQCSITIRVVVVLSFGQMVAVVYLGASTSLQKKNRFAVCRTHTYCTVPGNVVSVDVFSKSLAKIHCRHKDES